MKAVILAAGLGSRLLPLTKNQPKCTLRVNGTSLIENQLAIFRGLGIRDVTIVTGYLAEQLQLPGVKTLFNDDYRNNNILFSMMYAAGELDDDVIVSYSDILYGKETVEKLLAAKGDFLAVVDEDWKKIYVGRKDHPVEQAEKVVLENGSIRKIGKHLGEPEAHGEFIGLLRMSKEGAQTLKTVFGEIAKKHAGKPFQAAKTVEKAYLTDMLQELIGRGHEVTPVKIQGGWREIDTFEDFLKAGGEVGSDLRVGQNLRGILNDLKRRPEDAAAELGIPVKEIEDVIAGRAPLSSALVEKATATWPVSPREFYLLEDDSPSGVRFFRAAESAKSGRVMARAGKDYYEYRDTAMSSLSQFRPEWIQELCVVDDDDPENAAVQWNNGHFLHQFTYFVGPVNFYYRGMDGKKKVAVMSTGDSMYITPFVPHSFASRRNEKNELGFILALTYGNKLAGEARQEISALGLELAAGLALDFSSPKKASASLLRFHRDGASLSRAELAKRADLAPEKVERFESGAEQPAEADLRRLAAALRVHVRDLLVGDAFEDTVLVQHRKDSPRWSHPDGEAAYEMVELCPVKSLPFSRGIEVNVRADAEAGAAPKPDLQAGLHQYVYNVGTKPVTLSWWIDGARRESALAPGDSAYLKPCLPHCYRGAGGQLLVLRIGGRLGGDGLLELSRIAAAGKDNLARVVGESAQWYDPKGRRSIES